MFNDAQRGALPAPWVRPGELPGDGGGGGDLDDGVEAERDQRDRGGDRPGGQRDETRRSRRARRGCGGAGSGPGRSARPRRRSRPAAVPRSAAGRSACRACSAARGAARGPPGDQGRDRVPSASCTTSVRSPSGPDRTARTRSLMIGSLRSGSGGDRMGSRSEPARRGTTWRANGRGDRTGMIVVWPKHWHRPRLASGTVAGPGSTGMTTKRLLSDHHCARHGPPRGYSSVFRFACSDS